MPPLKLVLPGTVAAGGSSTLGQIRALNESLCDDVGFTPNRRKYVCMNSGIKALACSFALVPRKWSSVGSLPFTVCQRRSIHPFVSSEKAENISTPNSDIISRIVSVSLPYCKPIVLLQRDEHLCFIMLMITFLQNNLSKYL